MLFEIVRTVYAITGNIRLIPGLLLVGALTPPVASLALLFSRSLRPAIGVLTLAAVAAIGGVLGISVAALLEYNTAVGLGRLPPIAVAVIEETTKLVVPAVLLLLTRPRRPIDGLAAGICSGAGFAVLETLGFGAQQLLKTHERLTVVDATLLERGLFAPATHIAWTGMAAAGLWLAAGRHDWRGWGIFVGLFALAIGLHATWDQLASLPADLALSATSLAALALIGKHLVPPSAAVPPRT